MTEETRKKIEGKYPPGMIYAIDTKFLREAAKFGYDLAKEELNQAFADGVKQGIEQAKEDKITFLDCVPYQLCPKCNGNKTMATMAGFGYNTVDTCNICWGIGIIPMALK